ncbi:MULTISPECIES: hypothetical protein [unclassified Sphingobacterium]|uniref:hypothetical protein n=1 Tax=unclassified Sphingobacterium TaxID=2609468 RepID=UPI0010488B2D|nr:MULTISPECIES: hypothetical protein [unclassified Sphingobacterium]MCS3555645.1 hypothetical protein [Sphingobacterium sp. JUb21]TCR00902.1 hypothetical protein EDF66_111213 [Sphingobacterium sp. JUb20]
MKFNYHFIFVLFFILSGYASYSQERKILQFSGIVETISSGLPVGYTTITNESFRNEAYMANNEGFFSFVAHVGDTLRFTSVGYETLMYVIPNIQGDRLSTAIVMKNLITELPMVTPYPWASIEEFNIAFMNLEVDSDNIIRAKRNLSKESLDALAARVPRTADEMHNYNVNDNHRSMNNKVINQRYANPLLNPFAWGSLIQQISKGKKGK